MNAKADAETGRFDSVKLLLAALLLMGGIVAFYYFDDQMMVVRVLGLLAVAGIALFVASRSTTGRGMIGFIGGAYSEAQRVVWPSRAETVQTTLVVLVMVMVVGIALWLLDMFLLWAIQILTGQGG
jgi:preprotein translocase subunit SecE